MENIIVKQTIKMGNSSGVILPKKWKYKKVKIELVEDSIVSDLFEILNKKGLLREVVGIYLVGSYARGEESIESDVDVLVVTDSINKQLKEGIYEMVLVSKDKFEKSIKKSLYLLSLVKESKTILNDNFIKDYRGIKFQIPLKKYLLDIQSMLKTNEEIINSDADNGESVSDGTVYSVVLRLRELYIIECLMKNRDCTNKEFLKLIETNGGIKLYDAYLRIKNNKNSKDDLLPENVMKLIDCSKDYLIRLENGKK